MPLIERHLFYVRVSKSLVSGKIKNKLTNQFKARDNTFKK